MLDHRAFHRAHSGCGEVVLAFFGRVEVADAADGFPEVVDGPCSDTPEVGFEF